MSEPQTPDRQQVDAPSQRHAPRGPMKVKADPLGERHPMGAYVGGDALHGRLRCQAHSKQKGTQCGRTAIPGGTVCRYHGGKAPQVMAKAEERLLAMQPKAFDTIDRLMDREEFPTVQLQASAKVIEWTHGKAVERQVIEHSGGFTIRHELDVSEPAEVEVVASDPVKLLS